MENIDYKLLFENKEDWLLNNSRILKGAEEPIFNIATISYFINLDGENNITGEHYDFYISKCKSNIGYELFQKVESILEYRNIVKYGIKLKKYSIRIDEGMFSGSVDFDTLKELKEILSSKYKAKQLVPISYTPWDSIDLDIGCACKIEDLSLLYLYEKQTFEVRRY